MKSSSRLPHQPRRVVTFAVLGLVAVALPLTLNNYAVGLLNLALVFGIAAIGLNLVVGWLRELSFVHAGIMGLAAYSAALVESKAGVDMWLGLAASLAVAALVSLAIGLPTLKLRGFYFALATFGANVIIQQLINNNAGLTGGPFGLRDVGPLEIGGLELTGVRFYYAGALVAAVAVILAMRLRGSSYGRALIAIGESPRVAASMGLPVLRHKTTTFVISAMYAAVAGFLYGGLIGYLSPDAFGLTLSINLLIMVVVGGMGSIPGPLIGSLVVVLLPELLRATGRGYLLIYGVGLLLILIFFPSGIAGIARYRPVRAATRWLLGPPDEAAGPSGLGREPQATGSAE